MHARQLISIASTLASVGYVYQCAEIEATNDAAHGYWLANRFRCDAWHQQITRHRTAIETSGTSQRTRLWAEILPTLEEILASEPLTRVVAYIAGLLELRAADGDWSALAHSVLASHSEVRLRCLNLMVFGYGFPVEQAVRLNRLRRLMEMSSDKLISGLPALPELHVYVFDAALVAHQQRQHRVTAMNDAIDLRRLQPMVLSLERTLRQDHSPRVSNPRLNLTIAESALGLLPADVFDSFGVVRRRLYGALTHVSSDIDKTTDQFEQPYVDPFDLFASHRRDKIEQPRRRL